LCHKCISTLQSSICQKNAYDVGYYSGQVCPKVCIGYFIIFKELDSHVLKNQVNTHIIHDYNKAGARFWLIIGFLLKNQLQKINPTLRQTPGVSRFFQKQKIKKPKLAGSLKNKRN
jgi:hypothetical protein